MVVPEVLLYQLERLRHSTTINKLTKMIVYHCSHQYRQALPIQRPTLRKQRDGVSDRVEIESEFSRTNHSLAEAAFDRCYCSVYDASGSPQPHRRGRIEADRACAITSMSYAGSPQPHRRGRIEAR